jgi:hypothetical protein
VPHQLDDDPHRPLAEARVDRAYDARTRADDDPVADLERVVAAQAAGGDDAVAAA